MLPVKKSIIEIPPHVKIEVEVTAINSEGKRSGTINSNLEPYLGDKNSADAIEALILAHACEGIDILEQNYMDGIKTTLDTICNNMD